MKKQAFVAALCGLSLAGALALTGCGANLDRDVDVQGMAVSVPSEWIEEADETNDETRGTVVYEKFIEDPDDEPYTAVVISYAQPSDETPADAATALARKQQEIERKFTVALWSVDDERTEIIDGARVTTYEYSFEREIDHLSRKYEYQTAYVFDADMFYEITVYGTDTNVAAIVGTIEL